MTIVTGMKYNSGAIIANDCMYHMPDGLTGQNKKTEYLINEDPDDILRAFFIVSSGIRDNDTRKLLLDNSNSGNPFQKVKMLTNKVQPDNIDSEQAKRFIEITENKETDYLILRAYNDKLDFLNIKWGNVFQYIDVNVLGNGRHNDTYMIMTHGYYEHGAKDISPDDATSVVRDAINNCLEVRDKFKGYQIFRVTKEDENLFIEISEDIYAKKIPKNPFRKSEKYYINE